MRPTYFAFIDESGAAVAPKRERVGDRRLSLVITAAAESRSWCDPSALVRMPITCVSDALAFLNGVLGDETADIARVIIDGIIDARAFLDLLVLLAGHRGDVLWIAEDGCAYLSAVGRGDDRVIYALDQTDVGFYLKLHALTADSAAA